MHTDNTAISKKSKSGKQLDRYGLINKNTAKNVFVFAILQCFRHCWLGIRKSNLAVKTK